MGGNETVRTDVRLIAATHRDLQTLVEEGKFRLDLYYRLGVFTIHLPPLRERSADIPLLAQLYVRRYGQELGRELRDIAPETMERLCAHSWPGNIRELQNVLKQAVLRAQGITLLPAFLPALSEHRSSRPPQAPAIEPARRSNQSTCDVEQFVRQKLVTLDGNDLYSETREYVDRFLLPLVLERTGGNFRVTAQILGISRQTLRARLRLLGISVAHSVELDDNT